jgi:acyl dehydratase
MRVGDSVAVTRAFSAEDVAAYVALGGAEPAPGAVPGLMLGALVSYLLGVRLPGPGTNYLKQETTFLADAAVGEAVTARVSITRLRPDKFLVDLGVEVTGADGRLLATGRALVAARDTGLPFEV